MYTRNYEKARRHGGGQYAKQEYSDTLMIPRDYRGELLRTANREYAASYENDNTSDDSQSEQNPVSEPYEASGSENQDVADTRFPEDDDTQRTAGASEEHADEKEEASGASRGLFDGVLDLLIGKNSDEEETILLLGIALLLLSGHMERSAAGESWDADDLALMLIGYLLIG